MPFPPSVKEDALVACQRCCCLCHKFCGIKIEVHHIRKQSDGGADDLDNAIALCFDCHADQLAYDPSHPKGNKYSESELKRQRDKWFAKVLNSTGIACSEALIDTDRQVYRRLLAILPWDGSMAFVRQHDFHTSFSFTDLRDFFLFEEECDKPGFEFIDPDLEAQRGALLSGVWELQILTDFFTIETQDGSAVIPAAWSDGKPFFPEAADKVDASIAKLEETYRSLVRTATRKLGLLPNDISGT